MKFKIWIQEDFPLIQVVIFVKLVHLVIDGLLFDQISLGELSLSKMSFTLERELILNLGSAVDLSSQFVLMSHWRDVIDWEIRVLHVL